MRLSHRERATYDVGFATLDITIVEKYEERHLRHNQSSYVGKTRVPKGDTEEVSYTVSLLPKTPGRMLKISSTQYHTQTGTFLGIPSLSFNRTVPSDSPVFDLVSRGRMADLQKLLMQGQASLRDHDEHGTSLLQVRLRREPQLHSLLLTLRSTRLPNYNQTCVDFWLIMGLMSIIWHAA